jgi:hypothetical protein
LILLLAGCGGSSPAFSAAQKVIDESPTGALYAEVAEDDSYVKIDTNPEDAADGFLYDDEGAQLIQDVNTALGFPASTYEKMRKTPTGSDAQTDENDDFKVRWTYDVSKGIEVLYEKK